MTAFAFKFRAAGAAANLPLRGQIGLEFAREKLHMVQLERDPGAGIVLRARCSLPYPRQRDELLGSVRELKLLLARALKADQFKGRSVTSALPSNMVRTMSVTYEVERDGNADAALAAVMRSRLPESLDQYVIDYLPVRGSGDRGERLSVVAVARRSDVIGYLEVLRGCGLTVDALEIGPAAIKRLVTAMSDMDDPDNVLVINFGDTRTYLTMISGRRLLLDQEVDFGEIRLLEQIADALEVDLDAARELVAQHVMSSSDGGDSRNELPSLLPDDILNTMLQIIRPSFAPLLGEIKRTLMYAAAETRGAAARRIFLVGSVARWKSVDRVLSEMLDIDVVTIPDPLAQFCHGTPRRDPGEGAEPEIAVATGLALRGMLEHG